MPLRPAMASPVRIINPSVRTATAFANKMKDGRPLKNMPNPKKTGSLYKIGREEKRNEKRQDRYNAPPVPLNVPTMQEHKPTEEYFIHRTPTRNLPVYHLTKDGGNNKQTRVRKVEGQISRLKAQLEEVLVPVPEWIRINPVNQHIEMKVITPLNDIEATRGAILRLTRS